MKLTRLVVVVVVLGAGGGIYSSFSPSQVNREMFQSSSM